VRRIDLADRCEPRAPQADAPAHRVRCPGSRALTGR
jgi:hypothetical protein